MPAIKPSEKQLHVLFEKQNVSTPKIVLAARQAKSLFARLGNALKPALPLCGTLAAVGATYWWLELGAAAAVATVGLGMLSSKTGERYETKRLSGHLCTAAFVCGVLTVGCLVQGAVFLGDGERFATENAEAEALVRLGRGENSLTITGTSQDYFIGSKKYGAAIAGKICKSDDGNTMVARVNGHERAYVNSPDKPDNWVMVKGASTYNKKCELGK